METKKQDKNRQAVKRILLNLCGLFELKGFKQLAEYIDVPSTTVYGWIKNGNISDTGAILVKNPNINIGWLKTGEGPMLRPQTKVAATIEPGSKEKKNQLLARRRNYEAPGEKTNLPAATDESFDEHEAIDQTRYILRSDTVYRSALVSNIRAFHQGVKREEEMQGVDDRMRLMQEQMDRMEELLRSLGAILPAKRGSSES